MRSGPGALVSSGVAVYALLHCWATMLQLVPSESACILCREAEGGGGRGNQLLFSALWKNENTLNRVSPGTSSRIPTHIGRQIIPRSDPLAWVQHSRDSECPTQEDGDGGHNDGANVAGKSSTSTSGAVWARLALIIAIAQRA